MAFPIIVKHEQRRRRRLNGEDAWRVYGHAGVSTVQGADYFYARIPLGNPPQYMDFILDSGSSLPYIPCEKICDKCGKHTHPYYDFEKSKTYKKVACTDKWCNRYQCMPRENTCKFDVSYMEGSAVSGSWISDTISMKDGIDIHVHVGCIRTETKLIYGQDADGIMGIANSEVSLPNQILLNPIYENTFNLCFAHNGGFMEFGRNHIPTDLKYTQWQHGICRSEWIKFNTNFIELNGEKILPVGHGEYESKGYCGTTLDTGSSDILFGSKDLWNGFISTLEKFLKFDSKSSTGANLCYTGSDFEAMIESVPTMTFHFEGGAKIVAPYENIFYVKSKNKICTSIYNEGSGIMIGGSAVKNNFISIDKKNDRIGISQIDCKKFADKINVGHESISDVSPGAQKRGHKPSTAETNMVIPPESKAKEPKETEGNAIDNNEVDTPIEIIENLPTEEKENPKLKEQKVVKIDEENSSKQNEQKESTRIVKGKESEKNEEQKEATKTEKENVTKKTKEEPNFEQTDEAKNVEIVKTQTSEPEEKVKDEEKIVTVEEPENKKTKPIEDPWPSPNVMYTNHDDFVLPQMEIPTNPLDLRPATSTSTKIFIFAIVSYFIYWYVNKRKRNRNRRRYYEPIDLIGESDDSEDFDLEMFFQEDVVPIVPTKNTKRVVKKSN